MKKHNTQATPCRQSYLTDLTDAQWAVIEPLFVGTRNRRWPKRELLDAVLYLVDSDRKWRELPHDSRPFPPSGASTAARVSTGCGSASWTASWRKIAAGLANRRSQRWPSSIPAASRRRIAAKDTALTTVPARGKTKGRKLVIVTDTMGNMLAALSTAANVNDTKCGAPAAKLAAGKYPGLLVFFADMGYRGTFKRVEEEELGCAVSISPQIKLKGFVVQSVRWVVERTFAWLGNSRRLSKDCEVSLPSLQNMLFIAHSLMLLRRL